MKMKSCLLALGMRIAGLIVRVERQTMPTRISGLGVSLIGLWGVFSGLAAANPQPLPSTVLNSSGYQLNTSVNVPSGNPTYPVSFSFGSGGGFTSTIDSTNTIMWCVDAEEDIAPPTVYNADLVKVSTITNNSSYVRYGNAGSSQWALNLSGDNTAQQRYEMAAYLISQYPGYSPPGYAAPNPSNTLTDQELQAAIWETMWNSSVTPQGGITYNKVFNGGGAFNSTDENAVASYISQAQAFVNNSANTSFFNNFAVVSGGVNSNGTLQSPGIQTYICPLYPPATVPEPASVILLGSLLASVFGLTNRFRSRRTRPSC